MARKSSTVKEPKTPKKTVPLSTKIMAALRKVWRNSDARKEAINNARDPLAPNHLICSICGASVHEKLCAVDHIDPVVAIYGHSDWGSKIDRLFCPASGLRILCEARCHAGVTKQESQARAEYKKSLKPPKQPRAKKNKEN